MDLGFDWVSGYYGAWELNTEQKEARLIGATDIVGSYTAMRWAPPEQRRLFTQIAVDVFDEMVQQNAGHRPGRREYTERVKDRFEADPTPKSFIWSLLFSAVIGFLLQKLLEWLWNNYTQNAG